MPKKIADKRNKISILAPKSTSKEITPKQGVLSLQIERDEDFGGIGMGVLSDGRLYLNQRGLAALCGVENAHIGTISSQWNDPDQKPRIRAIKLILEKAGYAALAAHIEVARKGVIHFCYPAEICLAVLEFMPSMQGQTANRRRVTIIAFSPAPSSVSRYIPALAMIPQANARTNLINGMSASP